MITCAEAVSRLWDYLERDLSPGDRERVEQHLAFCRRCCGELAFAEELRRFMATPVRPELPPAVEQRLTGFLNDLNGELEGDRAR